ncbi:TIGR01244 family sulfur transferase [uncultured Roseovarius sp.]|uniref:TIGR01244 family sulfur transferase n=1 Tax=uncultured Roseovarius sp. TaxID=293344 RepID=UPI00261C9105|nr:TIGR01244 family sulfur transferase [uncultured Roseovarius sp.]
MDLRKISQDFTVSPQIEAADIPGIAEAGFRAVLCNRPDDEEYGQPPYDAVAEAAAAAGLTVRFVPVVSGHLTQVDADAFRNALEELPKPILAYCRTGTRCTMLWSLTKFEDLGGDEVLRATSDAGYDMSGLVAQLQRAR